VPFGFGNTPGSEGQDLAQQVARLVSAQMSNQSAFQESNVQYVPPLQQSQEPIQNNYNNTREPAASTQDANAQQRNLQAFNEQAQTALRNAEEELKAKRVKRLKVVTGIAIVTTVALAGGPVVQAATSRERAKEVCASQDILNIDNYGCYASEFLSEVFNANNIGKFVPEQN
jgi:stress response protein YsnF